MTIPYYECQKQSVLHFLFSNKLHRNTKLSPTVYSFIAHHPIPFYIYFSLTAL